MVAASTVVSAKNCLSSCELIPKLLCYSEQISDKCLIDCLNYVAAKYPFKMQNYEKIVTSAIGSYQKTEPKFYYQQIISISTTVPITSIESVIGNVRRQSIKKSVIFIEPNSSFQKFFEFPEDDHMVSGRQAPTYQTDANYIYLNQWCPITKVSDSNSLSDCGVESSRPSYLSYLSKQLFDKLFLINCQQHIPSNCHNRFTYEHRKHIATETLIQVIQQDACYFKYLSNVLYCGNRNLDNRNCCQLLEMASSKLEIGDRCLRIYNTALNKVIGSKLLKRTIWSVSTTGIFSRIMQAYLSVSLFQKIGLRMIN
ncbi:unnamed protein product [Onchocerca ochengi]|uniref:DB domain-containing protein n=2 Tax=Onchocerca TaxID=6281 RepID=A0A182ELJ7_ONCOC|nr:unnamed protein product [Onchocerca ochengi]